MSAITKPKRSAYDRTQFEPTPPAHREPEAPEAGFSTREAPETRKLRQAEAPEAASGRVAFVEQEFTHGRSQS